MKSILVFAFVLALAGGVIAYIGDRLGTYVGKKRISLIGLRPRHTATLYTTVSGGVISVLTLLTLVGLDQTFQRALLKGPQLVYDNYRYQQQIKDDRSSALKERIQASQVLSHLQQAESQLLPVQQQLLSAQTLLLHSRRALQQRQRQLGQAQAQLQDARAGLGQTNRQLQQQRRQVQQAEQAVADAGADVRTARQQVAQQQQRLSQLSEVRAHLRTANADLRRTNDRLKAASVRLAERTASSQQKLIFRSEQELGRVVIRAARPVPLIEADLSAFLDKLGQAAEARGAKEGVGGRAVVVAVPVTPDSPEYRPLTLLDERSAVAMLAQQIAAKSSDIPSVVLVARTVTNSFEGEQTSIRLQPYENVLIYPQGAPIASTTISGAGTPFQIVDALAAFLSDQVRPEVLRHHLIPQDDPETGQPMLGSVLDEAASQALVQQIQQLGGTVQVTAYAGDDTYSSGPLHLRLGIIPAGSPVTAGPPPAGRS